MLLINVGGVIYEDVEENYRFESLESQLGNFQPLDIDNPRIDADEGCSYEDYGQGHDFNHFLIFGIITMQSLFLLPPVVFDDFCRGRFVYISSCVWWLLYICTDELCMCEELMISNILSPKYF